MCLFTHFAAGALAGGLTGSVGLGALAGLASHAVLDVLPHYDHPDWRLELGGGIAALLLLLVMPFASWAAVIGGIAGMLPDLENLFQKLGKMRRDQFVYPTHTGLLKHGRPLGRGNLAVQGAIFVACYVALGLVQPQASLASADAGGFVEGGAPAAAMGDPVISVVSSTLNETVVRIEFPVVSVPSDWAAVDIGAIEFARQPLTDDLRVDEGGGHVTAPTLTFTVAVPRRGAASVSVVDVGWWREPTSDWDASDLVTVGLPAIHRGVPLVGIGVPLTVGGGVPSQITLAVGHSVEPMYRRAATFNGSGSKAPRPVPVGVVNAEVYSALAEVGTSRAKNLGKAVPFDPFAATRNWVRMEVRELGLYRLTGAQLAAYGVPVTSLDPAKLRLYRGGGMALELDPEFPDSLQIERTRLNEVAIEVVDGSDGEWNLDDELRFYGVPSSAWLDRFVPGSLPLAHYDHPFADAGIYWLSWENDATPSPLPGIPRRIPTVAAPATGGQLTEQARVRLHLEQQSVDAPAVVEDNWAWDTSISSSRTERFEALSPVPGTLARYVVDVRGNYVDGSNSFVFSASAWLNGDEPNRSTTTFDYFGQNDSTRVRIIGESNALTSGTNSFTVANTSAPQIRAKLLCLDSIDIAYWTELALDEARGQLEFCHWGEQVATPGEQVDLRISLAGATDGHVWDVTRPDSAFVLIGEIADGSLTCGLVRDPSSDRHIIAARAGDFLSIASGSRVLVPSLLDDDSEVDYVVVAASAFVQPAEDLAQYRSTSIPGVDSPAARAVNVEDVYNNFSGGMKDPVAVRNYLRRLFELGNGRLGYVCLLGRASRDYRNYRDRTPLADLYDLMPTFVRSSFPQFPVSSQMSMAFASDDGFVSFDTPPPVLQGLFDVDFPDVAIGRLPAINLAEARGMVASAIGYAAASPDGDWKNRVLMTADDVFRPSLSGPQISENVHTAESELISNSLLPQSLDNVKIYGVDYPFPPSSTVKPSMRAAINGALNEGSTLFYYVGHGADDNLADEQIFRSSDIANLGNGLRRPLFVAFSCDVGVFDSPARRAMAEEFLGYDSGGAIGAICASQLSWSGYNNLVGEAFFGNLFPGRHVSSEVTCGEALMLAKSAMPYTYARLNSQRYNLMGDPAVRLPHPVDDLQLSAATVDTLMSGTLATVVLDADSGAAVGQGDSYQLLVEESGYAKSYAVSGSGTATWRKSGAPVFDGQGTLGSGDLVVPFKVPAQIRYGDRGRVRLLVQTPDGDHAAVQTVPAVRGATGAVDDVRGPLIRLAFEDGRFRVRPGDPLTATLADTSGISILGTSPGNSLLLELDASGRMTNVTASFAYDPDSYTSGALVFPLPADLAAGAHKAALHASDALGNVGSDTLSFVIVPSGVAGIEDMTLFPNPTPGPCRLLFELSDPMAVQWDIYTLAGNRLRTMREEFSEAGPRILEWDGRDHRGDEIANGTYLYVVRGTGASADGREITKTGKLVIMR